MSGKYKRIIFNYLIGWFLARLIWELLRNTDLNAQNIEPVYRLAGFLITWLIQGFFYGTLYYFIERYLIRKIRYILLLFISLTLQVAVAALIVVLIYPIFRIIMNEFQLPFYEFIQLPVIPISLLFAFITNLVITIMLEVNLMLGKGTLMSIIQGKFYNPQIDQRIFMFIDLRGSTYIAEKLGHITFSSLMQDCFYDLAVVSKYKADVYKYVGDEAILIWNVEDGIKSMYCIKAFYTFEAEIRKRADYYRDKYNVVPEFKAGIHIGEVTIAEIGELKREIAYMGDIVNTTARIQDECNRLESGLLVSETLLQQLKLNTAFMASPKGEILLRGKAEKIKIYAIQKSE